MKVDRNSLLIVIPTRNRADLAMKALQSVIAEMPGQPISVVVSDNSTDIAEISRLQNFCMDLQNDRIKYKRPERALAMTEHWEWILQQSLLNFPSTHFSFFTDRMVFRPGALIELVGLLEKNPLKIISYKHDRVFDHRKPVSLEQEAWSGKTFQVDTRRLLNFARKSGYHSCFPRLLNCIVPRKVLQLINDQYGSICASISPDFSFCFRALEVVNNIVYYDKSLLLHYALNRSNGFSASRGVMTKDAKDFCDNLNEELNVWAPHPEYRTVHNAIINEYCFVKHESKSDKFGEVEIKPYLEKIAHELSEMENQELKNKMTLLLKQHGYGAPSVANAGIDNYVQERVDKKANLIWAELRFIRRLLGRIRRSIAGRIWRVNQYLHWISSGPESRKGWMIANKFFGITPPEDNRFVFESAQEAIDYAFRFPKRKVLSDCHLRFLHDTPN